jgi:hypothetical protein
MKRLVLVSLAALSAAFTASAQPAPKPAEQCFFTRDLRNHSVGGDHTLYFDVGGRSVYRFETSDNCLAAATSADPIVLHDRGSGQICNKLDVDISVRGARCIISSITKLTPEEAAALPRRVRP